MKHVKPLILALTIATAASAQNDVAMENYSKADADGDGALAYAEFVTFIDLNATAGLGRAPQISARGLHARAFARVDANGDGAVTPSEFQAFH